MRGRGLLRLGGVGVGVCRWGLWRGLGGFLSVSGVEGGEVR